MDCDVAVLTRAAGCDVDVLARRHGRSARGVAALCALALALRTADAEGELDAAELVRGIVADRIDAFFSGQDDVGCCQGFHARVAGVARCLAHLLRRLYCADDRAGDRYRQSTLFEPAFGFVVAGFSGFMDIDFLRADVDSSLWGDDGAAGLHIVLSGPQFDVALRAAYHRGCGCSGDALLVCALLLPAQGNAHAAAAEDAGFPVFPEVTLCRGVAG